VAAAGEGLLAGLMFSGCAARSSDYGPAWLDAHLPPSAADVAGFEDFGSLTSPSILGPSEIVDCLKAAGPAVAFLGLKISLQPPALTVDQRLARLRDALELLDRAAHTAGLQNDCRPVEEAGWLSRPAR
jgi:hypothetical protein